MLIDDLITLMERFVSGDAISVDEARKLEGALLEWVDTYPELEDLADDLAQYQAGGGDFLYDYARMKPRVAHHLQAIRGRRRRK
jgi:hypothetical protein